MATYAAQIVIMDRGIGRILASLERHRLSDNTIVMFYQTMAQQRKCPRTIKQEDYPPHRPAGRSRLQGRIRPHVGGCVQYPLPPV